MTGPGLLADLAIMMAQSPEDVATRGLELLLARSRAASAAMNRLLAEWRGNSDSAAVSHWASQVVATDRSRTDLEGFSADGATVAILENKFWAGLTDNQPAGYLQRLKTPGAVLAFVVPDSRVRILTHEIALRLSAHYKVEPQPHQVGDSVVLTSSGKPAVAVVGWSTVLRTLATAMEGAAEYDNHADMRQLQSLATRMDVDGFRPFRQSDLTSDVPRLILRLCGLVDGAIESLLTLPYANKKGLKATAGSGWYGHYLRIHGYGCQLIVTAPRWAAHGISPLWLRVSNSGWRLPTALGGALRSAVMNERWLFEEQGYWAGYWIAIRVQEERERDAVIDDIVLQIKRIASVLGEHPERESEADPPDAG